MTDRLRGGSPNLFTRPARDNEDAAREVLSVSEITRRIKKDLETNFQNVWIAGEISNLARPNSGHVYLTLKDEKTQLSAVIWKSTARHVRFELHDGLAVIAHGDVTVYPPRGAYQLIIRQLMPEGMGALQLAFQQLKNKLEKEGLFAPEHKKPLPAIHTFWKFVSRSFLIRRVISLTLRTSRAASSLSRACLVKRSGEPPLSRSVIHRYPERCCSQKARFQDTVW